MSENTSEKAPHERCGNCNISEELTKHPDCPSCGTEDTRSVEDLIKAVSEMYTPYARVAVGYYPHIQPFCWEVVAFATRGHSSHGGKTLREALVSLLNLNKTLATL